MAKLRGQPAFSSPRHGGARQPTFSSPRHGAPRPATLAAGSVPPAAPGVTRVRSASDANTHPQRASLNAADAHGLQHAATIDVEGKNELLSFRAHGDTNPRPDPAAAAAAYEAEAARMSATADVVLVLKHDRGHDDSARAKKQARGRIYKQICNSGLMLRRRQSSAVDDTGKPMYMFLLISASQPVLEKEAERLGMRKELDEQYRDPLCGVSGYESFARELRTKFRSDHEGQHLFSSLERQRIIFNKLEADVADGGASLDVDDLIALHDTFTAIFPLSYQPTVSKLTAWLWRPRDPIPVDLIRYYYGEQIAFYFAFMRHYLWWLLYVFPLATVVFAMQLFLGSSDNVLLPVFAVTLAVWSTLVVESWKQVSNGLAFRWASEDYLEAESVRAEFVRHPLSTRRAGVHTANGFVFTGDLGLAVVEVPFIPPLNQGLRVGWTSAVTALLMASVAGCAVAILAYKVILRVTYTGNWFAPYLGSVVNVAFMQVMDYVWRFVGVWLTDIEVWRTDSEYQNALLIKSVVFRFINSYSPPIYIAFFQGQNVHLFLSYPEDSALAGQPVVDSCPNGDCLTTLTLYMAVVIVMMEGARNLLTLAPLLLARLRSLRRNHNEAEARRHLEETGGRDEATAGRPSRVSEQMLRAAEIELKQIEHDYFLDEYRGTTVEMVEMAVQFGYLSSFAVAFPFALMFVLLNNFIEIRTDALKLVKSRRPRYRGASGVGPLLPVLELVCVVSVVSNAMLIAFYSTSLRKAFPDLRPERFFLVVVGFEHALFALKFFVVRMVSPTPHWVEASRTRLRIKREEEVKGLLRTKHLLELEAMASSSEDDEGEGDVKANRYVARGARLSRLLAA